jgi:Putative DNA-binding domain
MKLLELQRKFAADIMQSLVRGDKQSPKTKAGYIKPNDRLKPIERLEIYSRSYWFRLIDGMYEDFPGLRAVLGQRAFDMVVRAYLADCPSRSYTMRDLGSRLGDWLKKNPGYAGNKLAVCLDMFRVEWAHIEAWDGEHRKVLDPEDLIELGPNLGMGLQPHVRLLELSYPVDELRIKASRAEDEHEVASNAPSKLKTRRLKAAAARLKREQIFVAVHRLDFSIYYRRLEREEYQLLCAIRASKNIGAAMTAFYKQSSMPIDDLEPRIGNWFAIWSELGWLTPADSSQTPSRQAPSRKGGGPSTRPGKPS